MNLTPEQSGASQTACNIINNTFLSLDGFEPLRQQMTANQETNAVLNFAASLARVVDRELKNAAEKTEKTEKLETALGEIAKYGNDGICPYGCDCPNIAQEVLKNRVMSPRVVHDGQTIQVDHTVRAFQVSVRSMSSVGPETIKNLIETKYEVVAIKETGTTTVLS